MPRRWVRPASPIRRSARKRGSHYAGRPIPLSGLAPPALVERNQLVTLIFRRGGLDIRADGRALGRGAAGDEIRIMNLGSRSTIFGTVAGPALVTVP